jgi:uncharacterized membrane protein
VTAPHDELYDPEAEVEASSTERVITFSDAVVAIAITLLALAIPESISAHDLTNSQLLDSLRGHWSDYLAFFISFLVIGNHWATHRRIFRYVSRWNVVVGRLNMLWLLLMVLTPVAARLLAGNGAFGVRFGIYVLIQIIATGCLMLMSLEIVRSRLLRPDAPERARHPDMAPGLAVCLVFLVSIPVAFATDSSWTYAVWAGISPTTWILRQVLSNGSHTASGGSANSHHR